MRNFIEKMPLWMSLSNVKTCTGYVNVKNQVNITDPERHFEIEVPRRALRKSMLRYAILAFSSRHLNRGPGRDETEALHYYNKYLKPLIPALSVSGEG
jgi:hypothetical protein